MTGLKIRGYGAVFNTVDNGGDIIRPGAFTDTLELPFRAMLWNHEPSIPMGFWELMEERENGLWCEGVVLPSASHFEMVKAGAVCGLSIGYSTQSSEDIEPGGRLLKRLSLREVSLTTVPMHQMALFEIVP